MKDEKKPSQNKREDTIYAFVQPDDPGNVDSCLVLNLECTAELNNCRILFGDVSSGCFSPPSCFACVVDRSIVGKANWEQHLRSIETVALAQKPVYIIIDKEEYSTPETGKYIIITQNDGEFIATINDAITMLKFTADCEVGRDAEHMPPGLDTVFVASSDKHLRTSISRWGKQNRCNVIWNEDKDFEPSLSMSPLCCVFDKLSIPDKTWEKYQKAVSSNISISMVNEGNGVVIYSCIELEDQYYDIPVEACSSNPELGCLNKNGQMTLNRKEALEKIIGFLDEAKKYRDEILWPGKRDGYMDDCVKVLNIPNPERPFRVELRTVAI